MTTVPHRDSGPEPRQATYPGSFEKHHGKVTVMNGNLFYSPNSSRAVTPPADDPDQGRFKNIFDRKDARAELYHQPRWWTRRFGWISFIPINPSYSGPLFKRLAHVPTLHNVYLKNSEDGYAMPEATRQAWLRLEAHLSYATAAIGAEYGIPTIRPFSPWALGYTEPRKRHQVAVGQAFRARDWFQIWMGLMSYVIAHARTVKKKPQQLSWSELLLAHKFDQTWIDAIKSSTVHDFTGATSRAGAFVALQDVDEFQPEVAWFCYYQVPVWYRWGPGEASNPSYAHLAPLSHQLQEAATVLLREPSAIPPSESPPARDVGDGLAGRSSGPPKQFIAFLAARAERNKMRLLTETPQARQTRLNRERHPPTVSAKVYIWEPSDADPAIWVREPVPVRDREDTLGEYSASQRIYDSFSNEWDICGAYGTPDDDEHDEDFFLINRPGQENEDDGEFDPSQRTVPPYDNLTGPRALTPPPQAAHIHDAEPLHIPRFHPIRVDTPTTSESASNPSLTPKADALQQEILEILYLFYGYTPPLPLPTSSPAPPSEAECKKLTRLLGLLWKDCKDHINTLPVTTLAKSYLDGIIANKRPPDSICDFNVRTRVSIASCWRFKFLRVIETVDEKPQPLYMFDFGTNSPAPWKLTLTTAANALLVCRLDHRLDEYDLAYYLLQHGIPFRTMLPSHLAHHGPREPPPPCVLPTRLSTAQFSRKDYDAYVSQRAAIVHHPRARAALLHGGFHWRLCAPTVSFESVLQGPTGWNPIPGTMFVAKDPRTNETYLDDRLTEVEMDLITGTYICHTHLANQIATRSWYPLATTFEAGGENYGRWNSYAEHGFLQRLDEIKDYSHAGDKRGPLTAKKWRDLNRGLKEVRRMKDNIECWSQAFIHQHLHA